MLADSPELAMRVGLSAIAMIGLLLLLGGMIGFEQHRRGRLTLLIVGALLVLSSVVAVLWTNWPF
ncbi:hypothetical protein [Amnibacterium kyonggiense]